MTKTGAADILANAVRVKARKFDCPISKGLVEEVMNEARHWEGRYADAVATAPAVATVLRVAKRWPL